MRGPDVDRITAFLWWFGRFIERDGLALQDMAQRRERSAIMRRLPPGTAARCACGKCDGKRYTVLRLSGLNNDVLLKEPYGFERYVPPEYVRAVTKRGA